MVRIGIDIGGTGIQLGVVDEKGNILQKGGIVTRTDIPFEEQVGQIVACVKGTLAAGDWTAEDLESVGVGVPGLADRNGNVIFCTNLGWKNVPFRETFVRLFGREVPVYIDNDATVAGLAESVAGVSAGTSSSVFITLGTGVGGGIVINGKVWSGAHGVGSEIGHMILELDGEPCTCGNKGCLERYCSATAIIRMAREQMIKHSDSLIMTMAGGDPANINAKIVFDAAREGDPTALKVFRRYVSCLGQAIASIIQFMDPEVIVLGGGVSKAGDFLLDAVKAEVKKYVLYHHHPYSDIMIARLGPDAGIIGAAMLS